LRSSGFFHSALAAACCLLLGSVCQLCAETAKPTAPTRATPATRATSSSARKSTHKSTAKHTASVHRRYSRRGRRRTARNRGQQKIDSTRAQEIQQALIRQHYLSGEPSGKWDSATQAAMQRYQSDNGWQAKTVPDARALIKLGLGPDQEHLLNPETAMTGQLSTSDANNKSKPADPQPDTKPQK